MQPRRREAAHRPLLQPTGDQVSVTQSSNSETEPEPEPKPSFTHRQEIGEKRPPPSAPLRRRTKTIWLLALYIPLLLLPWIFTCILNFRPISTKTYISHEGLNTPAQFRANDNWQKAIRVFNSILSLVTIPVISAILAQAAVAYTQKQKSSKRLTLRQTFALADRGWSDITILLDFLAGDADKKLGSSFLGFAVVLILLCSLNQPLQQLLVQIRSLQVVTCNDVPYHLVNDSTCHWNTVQEVIGHDPEPWNILNVPHIQVTQQVTNNLIAGSYDDDQPRLWINASNPVTSAVSTLNYLFNPFGVVPVGGITAWVSLLPNGTSTGVLREHATRLNSSINCQPVQRSEYPASCHGSGQFATEYNYESETGQLTISVCVPGNYSQSPWTKTRDRQDISEDMFIDVFGTKNYDNYTMHCQAATTKGYFELPNYYNNFQAQPLLVEWPTVDTLWTEFNDYGSIDEDYGNLTKMSNESQGDPGAFILSTEAYYQPGINNPTPGPLATSALAVFGNQSFFQMAVNSTKSDDGARTAEQSCTEGNIPFLSLVTFADYSPCNPYFDADSTALLLYNWIQMFINDNQTANDVWGSALFYANEALLQKSAESSDSSRQIFRSDGITVQKPHVALAPLIVISVIIGLQAVAMLTLAVYLYRNPTWSASLDAFAMARIGASLTGQGDLPPIAPVGAMSYKGLDKLDGLIGVVEEYDPDISDSGQGRRLAIGAGGLVNRRDRFALTN